VDGRPPQSDAVGDCRLHSIAQPSPQRKQWTFTTTLDAHASVLKRMAVPKLIQHKRGPFRPAHLMRASGSRGGSRWRGEHKPVRGQSSSGGTKTAGARAAHLDEPDLVRQRLKLNGFPVESVLSTFTTQTQGRGHKLNSRSVQCVLNICTTAEGAKSRWLCHGQSKQSSFSTAVAVKKGRLRGGMRLKNFLMCVSHSTCTVV